MFKKKTYKIKKSSLELEPEEIFLDSQKLIRQEKGEPIEGKIEPPLKKRVFITLGVIFTSVFLLLFSQTIFLQVLKGNYFESLSKSNQTRIYPIRSPRAIIYDQSGEQLVTNVPTFNAILEPRDLPKDFEKRKEVLERLETIFHQPPTTFSKMVGAKPSTISREIVLAKNLDHETFLILKSEIEDLPGLIIEESLRRQYLDPQYFSHILGYCAPVDKKDLKAYPDYYLTDFIGKTGLEKEYESILRGEYGKKEVKIDALGNVLEEIIISEPKSGKGLSLSISASLQRKVYEALDKKRKEVGSPGAAAIALNPQTGQILALVSLPSYNNNLFAKGISIEDYEILISNPAAPLFNRVISGGYPTGSTIKPLLASAALEEKIISPQKIIHCSGAILAGNRIYHDWKIHGNLNIIKAIAESCNVYFYTVGGGYGNIEGLGEERIGKYLKKFGWGKNLGIDLPEEYSGFIPNREEREKIGEKWYLGDTYNISIGQGELKVTPLQITSAIGAIANGGKLFQPQIVDKILNLDSNPPTTHNNILKDIKPKIINENFISKENLEIAKKGMREAVISGSSRYLSNLSIKVAGKTGTAETGGKKKPYAWFTGFAPYHHPEIVLTILIEEGEGGSKTAVPVAKEIFEWYFENLSP